MRARTRITDSLIRRGRPVSVSSAFGVLVARVRPLHAFCNIEALCVEVFSRLERNPLFQTSVLFDGRVPFSPTLPGSHQRARSVDLSGGGEGITIRYCGPRGLRICSSLVYALVYGPLVYAPLVYAPLANASKVGARREKERARRVVDALIDE